ncbi:signal peptidase II [Candidatus Pelagibacter sp. HIMB123]|uniref:signal peptidase II n=1 Tax=Candidatus Pelagibacter sp. HIMB123 TaxID=3415413 RepID=UPI003F86C36E
MIIKNSGKNFIINLSLIVLIFLFDRISKIYVIYLDKKFLGSQIFSSEFLNITLIWNEGIAFGLFSFDEKYFYNILTLFIVIIILIIFFMLIKSKGFKKYALLIILSGALGNVFDRIFYKAVPDFIDFHIGDFHWFIFNIADVFITLGVFFMILSEFIGNNNVKDYEKF